MIEISVADTGVGIKKEDQEKLFKLFGFLDRTKELNTGGVGLGLHISK
jgi:signal transduction histidine kinase